MLLNLFVVLMAAALVWVVQTKLTLDRLPKLGVSITIIAVVLLWLIVGAAPTTP